jgi:predicted nucleic acid-binding protein
MNNRRSSTSSASRDRCFTEVKWDSKNEASPAPCASAFSLASGTQCARRHHGLTRSGAGLKSGLFCLSPCVAYPEALSAFARRYRDSDLDEDGFHQVVERFQRDWDGFAVVEVQERLAGQMTIRHVLRGFDAVHLAAALSPRHAVPTLTFTSFDNRLNQAAAQEGLTVLMP